MPRIPNETEVRGYIKTLTNWGRWGPDDQLGTLNFLTATKTVEAATLIQTGITVSCARPIRAESAPDVKIPPLHFMIGSGEVAKEEGADSSSDFIGLAYHGSTITHVDGICHMFWEGKMYNNLPANLVTTRDGALAGNIDLLKNGVIAKGILLDIPRVRGVDWMEPGQGVMPEDLELAEKAQGVQVNAGDILLIRTGNYKRRLALGARGDGNPGPQAAILPWIHQKEIAMLGSDTPNDPSPLEYPNLGLPIHHIGIVQMGLWLLDNANLEELAETCIALNRWEFFLSVGTLRIHNATGSPVNPIAVF